MECKFIGTENCSTQHLSNIPKGFKDTYIVMCIRVMNERVWKKTVMGFMNWEVYGFTEYWKGKNLEKISVRRSMFKLNGPGRNLKSRTYHEDCAT